MHNVQSVEPQVMRLPRYAGGLRLVRLGVLAMLLQLGLAIVVAIKTLSVNTQSDATSLIEWIKYLQWANLGAIVAMLIGTLLTVPDFLAARMSIARVAIAGLGFAITAAAILWSYRALAAFLDAAVDPESSLDEMSHAATRLESLPLVTAAKDVAYSIGLIAIIRSIRQTAIANDHGALREAASSVSRLIAGMLAADVLFQLLRSGTGLTITFALVGLLGGLGTLGYWVYCHLRIAKLLRAASYLVDQPHSLPSATIVSSAASAPATAPRAAVIRRPTAPVARAASKPSPPVIAVATELRVAPTPRADTAPGEPPPEGPAFLK